MPIERKWIVVFLTLIFAIIALCIVGFGIPLFGEYDIPILGKAVNIMVDVSLILVGLMLIGLASVLIMFFGKEDAHVGSDYYDYATNLVAGIVGGILVVLFGTGLESVGVFALKVGWSAIYIGIGWLMLSMLRRKMKESNKG